jgi:penicillin-binding protein 2
VSDRRDFHPYILALRARGARHALTLAFLLLGGAFFRLQVLEHDRYRMQSESNRLRPVPLPAPRGLILDRHGAVIAENVPGYSVSLLAQNEDSLTAMLSRLRAFIPLDSAAIEHLQARFRAAPYEPTVLVKDASFRLVSELEEHNLVLPGLVIQTEPKREYPDSSVVAHLVGYVGEVTEQDLAGPYAGRRPGSIIGKDGLEREYDSTLAGADGVRFVEVDALGRVVRERGAAATLAAVPGRPLRTTIDLGLQRFVASIFPPGRRGAIVAMDPWSGDVLALYSSPSFDPNEFVGGVAPERWDELSTDPTHPLLDRAIAARYPPASTFKLATAVMALRDGLVGFNSHMPLPCRGGIQYGNRFFRCWYAPGHGSLNLVQAIAESCDSYFYQLGLRLSVSSIVAGGAALGFGSRTGIDLPGEARPAFPDSGYYDRVYGRGGWTQAVAMNLAIGQGEDAQTLINMVRFYAALANGGRVVKPHLRAGESPTVTEIGLSDSTLQGLRDALIAVVQRGTARSVRLAQLQLAGKTGTAQNPHGPDHGWFIGFAPARRPEIVVGGIIENAVHGTVVAPYVARVIERYVLGADTTTSARLAARVPLRVPDDTALRPVAVDTASPRVSTDTAHRGAAPRGARRLEPADTGLDRVPAGGALRPAPADTGHRAAPADTVRPAQPADTMHPAAPAGTVHRRGPADTAPPGPSAR